MATTKTPTPAATPAAASVSVSTAIAKVPKSETGQFVSAESFSELRFWKELETKERNAVLRDGQELIRAIEIHGTSKLAIGEHLLNIQTTLLPHHGAWRNFLRSFRYKFSQATAFRYITAYKNLRDRLPMMVVRAAIVRNMGIVGYDDKKPLGVYTSAVKALPPPKNPSPAAADRYLDQLQEKLTQQRTVTGRKAAKAEAAQDAEAFDAIRNDPTFMQKHSFRIVKNNLMKLPSRQRRKWLISLVGMLLTEINSAADLTASPIDVPEGFNQGKGRPKLVRDEPEADMNDTLGATG